MCDNSPTTCPVCVPMCWENSKYVSSCRESQRCLCEDAQFQGAVLQCLYSQCQTSQFGCALHHTMAHCFEEDSQTVQTLPALIRHQALRKRQIPGAYASASVSSSAVHSVARGQLSASALDNARPTRSASSTSLLTDVIPIAVPTGPFP
ncbi:MAG: hypothetical protein LQ339_001231 [Xanthoria mediterranea]|nr:MAG: hypothetical protein LQ339_001231 [Xanthoria mediterranea]